MVTKQEISEVDYEYSEPSNEQTVYRRNRPGTSAKDWCKWADQDLDEMESTLAVQQYIQQLIKNDSSQVDTILQAPEQQDESIWKYEHVRQFCLELNLITLKLQTECNPATCTQMTATEQWIFLCAAHKNPKECTAIDYTRHTLDGAACLLNSNRYFPSRVNIKESSVQKLGSICRRIYRIFSHAYFHHRKIYDDFEKETSLCRRFTRFVTKYDLMTSDTLIVPIDEDSQFLDPIRTTENTLVHNDLDSKSRTSIIAACSGSMQSEEDVDLLPVATQIQPVPFGSENVEVEEEKKVNNESDA